MAEGSNSGYTVNTRTEHLPQVNLQSSALDTITV